MTARLVYALGVVRGNHAGGSGRERSMKAVLLSLADFFRAGVSPRTPLARAIVLALVIKLVVISAIWLAWFSGDARPRADAAAVARLLGPTTPLH